MKTVLQKNWIKGILMMLAVFILVALLTNTPSIKTPRSERQQLDALLGTPPKLEDDSMAGSFDKNFNLFGKEGFPFNQSWSDMEKTFAEQRRMMDEQMHASMQAMDQFQKRMQAEKPYQVTSDDKNVVITIALKDKQDALNYTIDIQPNGFVIQHRQVIGQSQQKPGQAQTGTQTAVQSYMESFADVLQADKATQTVKGNQLVVVIPKQPGRTGPDNQQASQPVQVYGGTSSGQTPEDAI